MTDKPSMRPESLELSPGNLTEATPVFTETTPEEAEMKSRYETLTPETMEYVKSIVAMTNAKTDVFKIVQKLTSETFIESVKKIIDDNVKQIHRIEEYMKSLNTGTFGEALSYLDSLLSDEEKQRDFLSFAGITTEELNQLSPVELLEYAEKYRAEREKVTNPVKYEKYDLNYFNEIPLFHSTIVNKIFGTFGAVLPIDGKSRNLASDSEYYITEVNGKKLRKQLVIEASMENINELLQITGLTQFDFIVWCICDKCWNVENRFFTTFDLYKLFKQDKKAKPSEYMLNRYETSIEKLSAIRLKVKTKDRHGNPKTELRNMLTTAGESRLTSNGKMTTGYIMLAPPALNGFSLEMNPFYNIPLDLLNYPTRGKQDRAVCIASYLIQRIELKKTELKKTQKAAYDKALKTAKAAEKQTALKEHRKPNNKSLDTEKYYPKIYYKNYRAVINVQELCERVEEASEISKDVKSKIVSEAKKCLDHFQEKRYIKGFSIPAGKHNKTENIIIEIHDVEVPVEVEKIE